MIEKIKNKVAQIVRFLSHDIWRIDKSDTSSLKDKFYTVIKSFVLTYRNIDISQLNTRAAALTYNTLLSIVPLLAVLFAIAGGFGFQNIVKSELFSYFQGQKEVLEKAMVFVDDTLKYASSGIFLGVGLVMLIYTVVSLMSNIEGNFNAIWRIKEGRSYYRQFTDYIALLLIAPVFLVLNSGLTIFLNSSLDMELIGIFVAPIVKIVPFAITILLFTIFYIYIPNTKVHFSSALFGAVFAGTAFQIFQIIYISGQIWISKYNAIYGSFAALPLLLLWLQLSWFICLIGVELSFAHQNIKKFSFEREVNKISRRYKDFTILFITALIIKRFEKGLDPYSADELSEHFRIPTQLTNDVLYLLTETDIIIKTSLKEKDDRSHGYVPAIDINKISVNYLFEKIDRHGLEDFKIGKNIKFKKEWDIINDLRSLDETKDILIKDL